MSTQVQTTTKIAQYTRHGVALTTCSKSSTPAAGRRALTEQTGGGRDDGRPVVDGADVEGVAGDWGQVFQQHQRLLLQHPRRRHLHHRPSVWQGTKVKALKRWRQGEAPNMQLARATRGYLHSDSQLNKKCWLGYIFWKNEFDQKSFYVKCETLCEYFHTARHEDDRQKMQRTGGNGN